MTFAAPSDFAFRRGDAPGPVPGVVKPYVPKEVFSPTQIDTYRLCQARWGFGWLLGIKSLPGPAQTFGISGHKELEKYFQGGQIDVSTEPGKRALAMLPFLPRREVSVFETERAIAIDTVPLIGEQIQISGFRDLASQSEENGIWELYDYKFTSDLKWARTSKDLLEDTQANFYGLDLIQNKFQHEVRGGWIYSVTRDRPKAISSPLHLVRDRVEMVVTERLRTALEMRDHVRNRTDPNELAHNRSACSMYGKEGCPHRPANGGLCKITHNLGDMIMTQGSGLMAMLAQKREGAAPVAAQPPAAPAAPPAAPVNAPPQDTPIPPDEPKRRGGPGRPAGAKNKADEEEWALAFLQGSGPAELIKMLGLSEQTPEAIVDFAKMIGKAAVK